MAKQVSPVDQLWKTVSRPIGALLKDTDLKAAQEKEFLRTQVTKHWQIKKGVEEGNQITIQSVADAAREVAAMGLTMAPSAQLVYFIPRRARKQWNNETDADYKKNCPWLVVPTPSYRGLSYIAINYGGVSRIAAEVVYQTEFERKHNFEQASAKGIPYFQYMGPVHEPRHIPEMNSDKRRERDARGAYAVAIMKDGGIAAEYIDAETIMRIRQMSDNPNGSMWTTVYTEGWRKSVIRRMSKLLMTTCPQMLAATEVMDRSEGITFDHETQQPEQEQPAQDEPKKGMEALEQLVTQPAPGEDFAEGEMLPPLDTILEDWKTMLNDAADSRELVSIGNQIKDGATPEHQKELEAVYLKRQGELRG